MPPGWPLCACEWKRATECQSKIGLHSAEKTVCIDAAAPSAIRQGRQSERANQASVCTTPHEFRQRYRLRLRGEDSSLPNEDPMPSFLASSGALAFIAAYLSPYQSKSVRTGRTE